MAGSTQSNEVFLGVVATVSQGSYVVYFLGWFVVSLALTPLTQGVRCHIGFAYGSPLCPIVFPMGRVSVESFVVSRDQGSVFLTVVPIGQSRTPLHLTGLSG